ncbi:unnamed protein product [Polarella glacialis]|uniref:Methylenetetrahydrofolate reductase (NAD(P)H) n=1 Tax=Polarella glacialis TaxID=89957 RepID=A0A813JE93_POLGL|nr:unnamed protein product [Polarella glacialis]
MPLLALSATAGLQVRAWQPSPRAAFLQNSLLLGRRRFKHSCTAFSAGAFIGAAVATASFPCVRNRGRVRAMAAVQSVDVRLEFMKRGRQLEQSVIPFLSSRAASALGGLRVNVPNKATGQSAEMLATTRMLVAKVPDIDVCLHYCFKLMPSGVEALCDFCVEASQAGARSLLLVTGTGKKPKMDAAAYLQLLAVALGRDHKGLKIPILGVAFSPYEDPGPEQALLKKKLSSGLVREIWLKNGSDLCALRCGLEFLCQAAPGVRVYGSIFLPTPSLLAKMRERPWAGVYLDKNKFLDSVEDAEHVTRQILQLYADFGVTPLVESALDDVKSLQQLQRLLADSAKQRIIIEPPPEMFPTSAPSLLQHKLRREILPTSAPSMLQHSQQSESSPKRIWQRRVPSAPAVPAVDPQSILRQC